MFSFINYCLEVLRPQVFPSSVSSVFLDVFDVIRTAVFDYSIELYGSD